MARGRMERKAGVTLLELLVVVAILVILTAILVPTVMYARRAAQRAETTHLLGALQNACEAYFQSFNDFPGPVLETNLGAGTTVSGSQNLLMGLMGQLSRTNAFGGDGVSLGGSVTAHTAPDTLSTVKDLANGQSFPQFYRGKASEIGYVKGVVGSQANLKVFYDHYGDPLPILYFRRTRWPLLSGPVREVPVVNTADTTTNASYYRNSNAMYLDSTALESLTGTAYSQAESGYTVANENVGVANAYFFTSHLENVLTNGATEAAYTPQSAAQLTVVKNARKAQGNYVLMSAGADRLFGPAVKGGQKVRESDDIVVFSR